MDLLQLEYFLKVARCANMSVAAEEMNVAQSSVSRSIARLEQDLGFPLFDRTGRGIVLSAAGKAYLPYVERALQSLEDGRTDVTEALGKAGYKLSFSVPISRLVQKPLLDYLQENQGVRVRQHFLPEPAQIKSALERGEIDFALSYEPVDDLNYQWQSLMKERFYFIVLKDHRLAKRSFVDLCDLDGERVVMNESDNPDRLIEACRRAGATLDIVFCGNEIEGMGTMIEMGLGSAFISAYSQYEREHYLPENARSLVAVIPIRDEWFSRELGLVTQKYHYLPAAAKEFCRCLRKHYNDISYVLEHLGRE